jgi:metal-sulfur cluster biosynthetic enzyme
MKTCNETLMVSIQSVRDVLLKVIDPEVGENIIDLGLVYDIKVSGNVVKVTFTMTSQACPMGEMLLDDIHTTLTRMLPGEIEFDMNLVWEPQWKSDMMSVKAKQRLGWD